MAGCEESFGFYFIFVLLTYVLWMDLSFFDELAEFGSNYNATTASKLMFPEKSVKLRMTEHIDHYINLPLMKLANQELGISSIPGITPNVVSVVHFFCAIIAVKFVASGSLALRRVGCAIYEFRNQLDLLDGVVYRAQSKAKTSFVSGWGSSGYYVDAAMDFGGGLLLAFTIGYFLTRFPPLKRVRIQKRDLEANRKLLPDKVLEERPAFLQVRVDRRTITVKVLLATIQIILRSGLWDYFQRSYHELLEKPNPLISKELQAEVLNYRSTWVVLWLWKISSADAFFQFTLLAILFDKLWEYMKLMFYAGWFQLAGVVLLSQLHLTELFGRRNIEYQKQNIQLLAGPNMVRAYLTGS